MAEDNIKVATKGKRKSPGGTNGFIVHMVGKTTLIKDPENMDHEPRKFNFDFSYWSHDEFKELDNGYLAPTGSKYADQKIVFEDLGVGVLDNAWAGYNCSLFAYGQTGSGKSYSMVGYGQNKGIVPITCERLFQGIDKKIEEKSDKEYQVKVSMLEIYNEQVRDLLNPASLKIKGGMKVRQHPKLGFYVEQLVARPVGSYKDIDAHIEAGTKSRTVASTNMNATSSRAHTIVAINFSQKGDNAAGQSTTMTSIINLVDLAGSERADSTGATGDRLKEGSAINQSLSSLGNVIKALADQSGGKKNVIVPYRDSTLTKLLKNALGGNSKTIMIAALSPADINHDETLSTLRFADRAKSIKTKAVVNESPTEKLIRELREENERLLNALKAGGIATEAPQQQQQQQQQSGISEEEVEEMKKEMEERLKQNQTEMEAMKKSWEERLKEQKDSSAAQVAAVKSEQERRKTTAHFWNLNEDPQLTNMVVHFIPKGDFKVGNQKADPPADIVLNGLSIQKQHATLQHKKEIIKIKPCPGAKCIVNGVQVVVETTLYHNDRVMFGNNHFYVLHHPHDPELKKKEKEAKKKGETVKQEAPTYEQAQEEIAKNSGFYGRLADKSNSSNREDLLIQEDLLKILPMISEANAMSEELNKKVVFEPVLISPQARGKKDGRTEVNVKVKNLANDNEWLWDKNKFINRKFIMQEMYQNYSDDDEWQVEEEKDPFWEPADADVMIGTVLVYLSSLGYKIELEENLAIADYKGVELGHLQVEIEPCTNNGRPLDDDDFVEDPHEIIGGDLNFKMKIPCARGIPQKFSKGETFCKYKIYLDTEYTCTDRVKHTINPDFKHQKLFSFAPVTTQLIEYIMTSPLVIEVWGKQSDTENANNNREAMSTKQLMNADNISKANVITSSGKNDDERYKIQSEINTVRKRNSRLNAKMARLRELIDKAKAANQTTLLVTDVNEVVNGSDKTDLMRFKAAADVIKITEKAKSKGDGKISSSACTLQ
eukprot:gene3504-4004_t